MSAENPEYTVDPVAQAAPQVTQPEPAATAPYVGPVDANGPITAPPPSLLKAAAEPEPEPEPEKKPDLEVILPPITADNLTIGGVKAIVKPLKARELFALIRVFTGGLGSTLGTFDLNTKDESELGVRIGAMAVMAIPNAYDEFLYFVNLITRPRIPSEAKQIEAALKEPEIDEMLAIVAVMCQQEAGTFMSTVKKAMAAFKAMPGLGK